MTNDQIKNWSFAGVMALVIGLWFCWHNEKTNRVGAERLLESSGALISKYPGYKGRLIIDSVYIYYRCSDSTNDSMDSGVMSVRNRPKGGTLIFRDSL